jgi:hypothetical protein
MESLEPTTVEANGGKRTSRREGKPLLPLASGSFEVRMSPLTARRSAVPVVLLAWLVAGTLDIAAAVIYYPIAAGVHPAVILQGIASGVLGTRAFDGGAGAVALGLLFHYLIALIWTVLFFLAARRFEALTRHTIPIGLAYGAVVWAVMNLIVVPLSNVRQRPFNPAEAAIAALILMFCIGLPIVGIIGSHERRGQ